MEHLTLSSDVLATVLITDIRHTLDEIDKHRHVHAMMRKIDRQRSQYANEYHRNHKK